MVGVLALSKWKSPMRVVPAFNVGVCFSIPNSLTSLSAMRLPKWPQSEGLRPGVDVPSVSVRSNLIENDFVFVLEDTKSLASPPSHTSSDGSTGVTDCRPCYAHAVNTCPTRAAGSSDLCDHAVCLCYWRGCHGVR
jgi:hypothetical protein